MEISGETQQRSDESPTRSDQTLYEMVREAASLHGPRVAVTFDSCTGSGTKSRTYSELLSSANELTALLEGQFTDPAPPPVLGLYCHPGIGLPAWLLGILQLPAAYAPLDPDAPTHLSVRFMDRCGLEFAVIQSELTQRFQKTFSAHLLVEVCAVWPSQGLTLVRVRRGDGSERRGQEESRVQEGVGCERDARGRHGGAAGSGSLAYMLHTSGTTGLPKTVGVPHRCIVPNILHLRSLFQVTSEDVVFMASPLTFDPSVVEMFLSLSSGARLLIVPTVIKKVPDRLATVLFEHHRITVLQATPTLVGRFGSGALRRVVLRAGTSLRILALGGEACPPVSVLRGWRAEGNSTRLFNLYGTTEVSCWATCYQLHLDTVGPEAVPLGSVLMGTVVEVRGEDGRAIACGEGQLLIGGEDRVCLLGDEVAVAKGTMRSTGDWVELRDSHLYYLGRRDRLVKRHGQRLHLDALQQVLQSLPQVEVCAVTLWEGLKLVAFVVPSSSGDPTPLLGGHTPSPGGPTPSSGELQREILGVLSQLVPAHSLPDAIVLLPALPLSAHGKVNIADLLQLYERQRAVLTSHDALGDRDTLRELLQKLWKEVLTLSDDALVAMDSHFLLSGGDSLRSLRLCDDITVAVGVALPGLLEVVLSGTFADLLSHVSMAALQREGGGDATPAPERPPRAKRRRRDPLHTAPPPAPPRREPPPSPPPRRRPGGGVTVVRRAGEVTERPPPSNQNHILDFHGNTGSHTTVPNQGTDHTHSRTEVPNQGTDHTHSRTEVPNQGTDHSRTEVPNQGTDHTHSRTEVPNQGTDHTHSRTEVPNQGTDHSRTEVPNQGTDHTHSRTEVPNQGTDHTHTHSAVSNQGTDHTHSRTAVPNQGTDHSHSRTAVPNQGTDHTHSRTAVPNQGTDHSHSRTAVPNQGTDHSRTAVSNQGTDHSHSRTAVSNQGTDHSHSAVSNQGTDHSHSRSAWPNGSAAAECEAGLGAECQAGLGAESEAGLGAESEAGLGAESEAGLGAECEAGLGAAARPLLDLRVRWRSDTGRCVDASAVLLLTQEEEEEEGGGVAYVGSHSHRLQALTLKGGALIWERVLGGRLEASAAVTACGSFIAIGCYDGLVYFLTVDTGQTHWEFATRDAVKSSPAVDLLSGLVLVGSHDGHVYALDPEARCCRWSRHCGGGAIFSSPCLHPSLRQLYVATLRGELLCLEPDTGSPLWTHSGAAPFFSSPCCSGTTVCIGSVDQNIYGFSTAGQQLWRFTSDGPVFSSPCCTPSALANQRVFCGSHDGRVYCLRASDGALLWRFQAGQRVFATPFLFHISAGQDECLVAVATTDGTLWIVGAEDGEPRASVSLPGEIFSSPVLWGRTLVVGCRNDFVYGIELTDS